MDYGSSSLVNYVMQYLFLTKRTVSVLTLGVLNKTRHKHMKVSEIHPLNFFVNIANMSFHPLIKPLFSTNNWQTANNVLNLIKNGYLSDPPGIPLYTIIGIDSRNGGLPLYRCARGTNTTEGGVHTHIRSRLPKFGTTIRHVNASLLDYVLRHNILSGIFNTTGQHYCYEP
ncbi:hypothetical protein AGABI1DRAFT_133904 [Agaricus bisporus var. burnettii JB137-S8]|uniref:Uncharacterized protein n=1 Tax=Agaricus bisporus var. burnettii (strain JB137-S8 / ATCC MYA-4627 / FGSC 10392) TaxID=597362 RepID=K5VHR7_AGABU|nr:uncharacterized protein AGABI1DRAFT_133904 [Agaricus bisporus var. burnettii JB137-S8]EKM73899.1 hypothetical protein AGABI1DRAFT_133904 [Agaricus bisporus var. burnettii JB137-S8]